MRDSVKVNTFAHPIAASEGLDIIQKGSWEAGSLANSYAHRAPTSGANYDGASK